MVQAITHKEVIERIKLIKTYANHHDMVPVYRVPYRTKTGYFDLIPKWYAEENSDIFKPCSFASLIKNQSLQFIIGTTTNIHVI